MTTYAIGSVFGNFQALQNLLQHIDFDPSHDFLWFAGNLIGPCPESPDVLRLVKGLGSRAVTVLGDQEFQLLKAAGKGAGMQAGDAWHEILTAPDQEQLLKWIRQRPLIHHDSKLKFTMVHAGIPHEWSFSQALTFTFEVESALSGAICNSFLENHRIDQSRWHAKLRGWKRMNFITNACTLMRYCNEQGKLDFDAEGPVRDQREELMPWYRVPERNSANLNIVFADDTDFQDDPYPGIYPLTGRDRLSVIKLGE